LQRRGTMRAKWRTVWSTAPVWFRLNQFELTEISIWTKKTVWLLMVGLQLYPQQPYLSQIRSHKNKFSQEQSGTTSKWVLVSGKNMSPSGKINKTDMILQKDINGVSCHIESHIKICYKKSSKS
jgi:hypothetical protein